MYRSRAAAIASFMVFADGTRMYIDAWRKIFLSLRMQDFNSYGPRMFKPTPERGWSSRMDRSPAGQKRTALPEATPSLLKSSRLLPRQHCVLAWARTLYVTMDTHAASANSWSRCCILQGGMWRGHGAVSMVSSWHPYYWTDWWTCNA